MVDRFVTRIEKLVADSGGQSALARRTGMSLGAIQRYLKGGEPTRGALVQIAEACNVSMDWLIYGDDGDIKTQSTAPLTVPVYGFAECGLQGWYNAVPYRLTTALDSPDPDLYAVIAAGHSMAPEGIHPGFICIVSPNTAVQKNDAVLIRKKDGTATIKLYQRSDAQWITVTGWLDTEKPGQAQIPFSDQIQKSSVDSIAPVIMVKRRV